MAITVSAIGDLIARYTSSKCENAVNLEAPFIGKGHIKTLKKPERYGVVNIKSSVSTFVVADGAAMPDRVSADLVQVTYQPFAFVTRLSLPRMAASLAAGAADGIDMVMEELTSAAESLARRLGRATFVQDLGTSSGYVVGANETSGTVFTVTDPSLLVVGALYKVYDTSGAAYMTTSATVDGISNVIKIYSISASTAGTFIVTHSGNLSAAIASADEISPYLVGAAADQMVSLTQVASTTSTDVYSGAATVPGWAGVTEATVTAFTAAALNDTVVQVRRLRGKQPTAVVLNSLNNQRLFESQDGNLQFYANDTLDAYGPTQRHMGIPVVVDENVPNTHAFLFNKEDVELHEFRAFDALTDGGKSASGRNGMHVDQSYLAWDVPIEGYYNLRVKRRNGTGAWTAIAS